MPSPKDTRGPLIETGVRRGLPRLRCLDGRWRKKRSDAGVSRGKYSKTRSDKGKSRGFSEDILAFLEHLKRAEEGKEPYYSRSDYDDDFEIF